MSRPGVLRHDRGRPDRHRQLLARRVPDHPHRLARRHRQGQRVRRRARRGAARRHPAPRTSLQRSSTPFDLTPPVATSASSTSASRAASPSPASAASRSASALSELGPLSVVLKPRVPGGILLEPNTGLTINDFVAGVEFFKTLPSIDDPFALRGPAFSLPTAMTADEWLDDAPAQVARAGQGAPGQPGAERLRGGVHGADDDHRLGEALLDLHLRRPSSTAR